MALFILSFAATTATAQMQIEPVSPEDKSFPKGYEVVPQPTEDAIAIKKMPPGLAKVAAFVEVNGRRFYMTDWSYDRYRRGESYNWIRPLGVGQGGGAASSISASPANSAVRLLRLDPHSPMLKFGQKLSVTLEIDNPLSEDGLALVIVSGNYQGEWISEVDHPVPDNSLQRLLDKGKNQITIQLVCPKGSAPVKIDQIQVSLANSNTGDLLERATFPVDYTWQSQAVLRLGEERPVRATDADVDMDRQLSALSKGVAQVDAKTQGAPLELRRGQSLLRRWEVNEGQAVKIELHQTYPEGAHVLRTFYFNHGSLFFAFNQMRAKLATLQYNDGTIGMAMKEEHCYFSAGRCIRVLTKTVQGPSDLDDLLKLAKKAELAVSDDIQTGTENLAVAPRLHAIKTAADFEAASSKPTQTAPTGTFSGKIVFTGPDGQKLPSERTVTLEAGKNPVLDSRDFIGGKPVASRVILKGSWQRGAFVSTRQEVVRTEFNEWVDEEINLQPSADGTTLSISAVYSSDGVKLRAEGVLKQVNTGR